MFSRCLENLNYCILISLDVVKLFDFYTNMLVLNSKINGFPATFLLRNTNRIVRNYYLFFLLPIVKSLIIWVKRWASDQRDLRLISFSVVLESLCVSKKRFKLSSHVCNMSSLRIKFVALRSERLVFPLIKNVSTVPLCKIKRNSSK